MGGPFREGAGPGGAALGEATPPALACAPPHRGARPRRVEPRSLRLRDRAWPRDLSTPAQSWERSK